METLKFLFYRMEIIYGDGIYSLPNNSLAGKTFEQLNKGEADLVMGMSLVVDFRARELTFLQPTISTLIHAFFQQPSANSIRNIVTAPFQTNLWFTLILTWTLLIITVKAGMLLRTKKYLEPLECSILKKNPVICNKEKIILEEVEKDTEFSNFVGLWAIAATCQKCMFNFFYKINYEIKFNLKFSSLVRQPKKHQFKARLHLRLTLQRRSLCRIFCHHRFNIGRKPCAAGSTFH
jgi:hypothetical protein